MYLTLAKEYRQAFLLGAAAKARLPLSIYLEGEAFIIHDMPAADVASVLAFCVFPCYEAKRCRALIRRELPFFDAEQQQRTFEILQYLLADDICRGTIASGPGRHTRIAQRLEEELARGSWILPAFAALR